MSPGVVTAPETTGTELEKKKTPSHRRQTAFCGPLCVPPAVADIRKGKGCVSVCRCVASSTYVGVRKGGGLILVCGLAEARVVDFSVHKCNKQQSKGIGHTQTHARPQWNDGIQYALPRRNCTVIVCVLGVCVRILLCLTSLFFLTTFRAPTSLSLLLYSSNFNNTPNPPLFGHPFHVKPPPCL